MSQGLDFLHRSDIKVHGYLKSSNIVVDSRFRCKLTDVNLQHLFSQEEHEEGYYNIRGTLRVYQEV